MACSAGKFDSRCGRSRPAIRSIAVRRAAASRTKGQLTGIGNEGTGESGTSAAALDAFKRSLEGRGQKVCSFSCHGNPLHPNPVIAQAAHEDFVATC